MKQSWATVRTSLMDLEDKKLCKQPKNLETHIADAEVMHFPNPARFFLENRLDNSLCVGPPRPAWAVGTGHNVLEVSKNVCKILCDFATLFGHFATFWVTFFRKQLYEYFWWHLAHCAGEGIIPNRSGIIIE